MGVVTDLTPNEVCAAWQEREFWPEEYGFDVQATNAVGNGWACRIGRVILVEQSSGVHKSYLYDHEREAVEQWPRFEAAYGEPAA